MDPPRERDVTWLAPRLVAQIAYGEWTDDRKLRQPVFLGLRDDKRPEEVTAAGGFMNLNDLITHPDKVFWPDEGYTKLDLARYYDAVFAKLRPYVADRLLSLERCPDGMRGDCFYQKAAPKGLPKDTPTQRIHHQNRDVEYVVGGLKDTQLALVNLGCIPVHVWASRASHPQQPDWMVFDLDPTSGKFADAAKAGLLVKNELDALGLASFPKTSGSRGLHVFVPLRLGPPTMTCCRSPRRFASVWPRIIPRN